MHFSSSTPALFHLWSFLITFTLCSLVIHFNGIVASPVVFFFFEAEWQSSFVLYSEVFAVDPCAATEEYLCSAGVCVFGGGIMPSDLLRLD